jgi:hypothetical protein
MGVVLVENPQTWVFGLSEGTWTRSETAASAAAPPGMSDDEFAATAAQLFAVWARHKGSVSALDLMLHQATFEVPDTPEARKVLDPYGLTPKQFEAEYSRRIFGPDPANPTYNKALDEKVTAEIAKLPPVAPTG